MNETLPLVSVIIPCYNAEKYVEQAVRSIMNQTYKNLEILITDDCSTDSSFEILQKLAEEDARIKLFKNEQNQKIVRTLNALVERANGKYIARMDADDISLPKRIEKQVSFMEKHIDYAICGTKIYYIDENNRYLRIPPMPISNEDIQIYKKYACPFYHPSVFAKKEILMKYPYDENFLCAEDYELWLRMLSNFKGYNLKNKLVKYRIVKTSISNDSKSHIRQIELTEKLRIINDISLIRKIKNLILSGSVLYKLLRENKLSVKDLLHENLFIRLVLFTIIEVICRIRCKILNLHIMNKYGRPEE